MIELTLATIGSDPWIPIFVILIPLGPLFSIVLSFTMIFMIFKTRATESMIEFLTTKYEVPDIVTSPDYIRSRVLSLVERNLIPNLVATEPSLATPPEETVTEPIEEESESGAEDNS